jgi:hypothetical protein
MTDRDVVDANDKVVGEAKAAGTAPPPGSPAKPGYISDQCRFEDALEDDEVRELLKAGHRPEC